MMLRQVTTNTYLIIELRPDDLAYPYLSSLGKAEGNLITLAQYANAATYFNVAQVNEATHHDPTVRGSADGNSASRRADRRRLLRTYRGMVRTHVDQIGLPG